MTFNVEMMTYLVEDGGHLLAVEADGEQGLLVVVGGDVEDEQVAAAHGGVEDTGVGVHATTNIDGCALKIEIYVLLSMY